MRRKIAGTIIILVGASFVIATFNSKLFSVAPAFERMTADFRPQMTPASIQALQRDLAGLTAARQEFVQKAVPGLAAAAKFTPQQMGALLQRQFPAVSAGMAAIPQIAGQFNGVLSTLQREQARFAKADAIPTSSLPATTVPWMLLVAGILTIGAGAFVLRSGRVAPVLAVALAGVLVIAPLAMSFPSKAGAADAMNKDLKPVYTGSMVVGAQQSLEMMQAMGTQMQTKMVPAMSQMLGLTPAQVQSYLGTNFPVLAQAMAGMPAALGRFSSMVSAFTASLPNYQTANGTALTPLVWLMIGGGLVCFVFGALASGGKPAEVVRIERMDRAA